MRVCYNRVHKSCLKPMCLCGHKSAATGVRLQESEIVKRLSRTRAIQHEESGFRSIEFDLILKYIRQDSLQILAWLLRFMPWMQDGKLGNPPMPCDYGLFNG